jgi:uncharacterized protein involved in exopolysaccharide biosynthesis
VFQTLAPNESCSFSRLALGEDRGQRLNLGHYIEILRRSVFRFLLPFSLISILDQHIAAIEKPNYLAKGKILVKTRRIAPNLVRPKLIQRPILPKDKLFSVARMVQLLNEREFST